MSRSEEMLEMIQEIFCAGHIQTISNCLGVKRSIYYCSGCRRKTIYLQSKGGLQHMNHDDISHFTRKNHNY